MFYYQEPDAKQKELMRAYSGAAHTHGDTRAWTSFVVRFRNYLKKLFPEYEITFEKGFYYASGFIYDPKRDSYCYISIGDPRFRNDLNEKQILVRTATGPKDYTGGHNNFPLIQELKVTVEKILDKKL